MDRTEAKELGERFYYTGKICKGGHFSQRYTKSGICVECATAKNKGVYSKRVSDEVLNMPNLVFIDVRTWEHAKGQLDDFVFTITRSRFPTLLLNDVCPKMAGTAPCGNGSFMFRYHLHCQDAPLVRRYAQTLMEQLLGGLLPS